MILTGSKLTFCIVLASVKNLFTLSLSTQVGDSENSARMYTLELLQSNGSGVYIRDM